MEECIAKKIRSIGILSKLRYYVGLDILLGYGVAASDFVKLEATKNLL